MPWSTNNRRKGFASKRATLTAALAIAALAAVPSSASAAGSVTSDGTTITYTGDGVVNNVTVTYSAPTYTFAETGISALPPCVALVGTATCPGATVTSVEANMGSGADVFTAATANIVPFTVNGNAGSDDLTGSVQSDLILGGAGVDNDVLNGGAGNDILSDNDPSGGGGDDDLNGNAGNDRLTGGPGNDDIDGGADIDRVLYFSLCSDEITITIDDIANDNGCQGETGDNVRTTVESVTGSPVANDTITGSCGPNTISGDSGTSNAGFSAGAADTINGDPDTCTGGNGADFLGGGKGSDVFNGDGTVGTAGFDTVTYGFPYDYTMFGATGISVSLDDIANDSDGWGNTAENVQSDIERVIGSTAPLLSDTIDATAALQAVSLFGRAGTDTLTDSTFGDFLNGEAGADIINCTNGGTDTNVADGADTVNGTC